MKKYQDYYKQDESYIRTSSQRLSENVFRLTKRQPNGELAKNLAQSLIQSGINRSGKESVQFGNGFETVFDDMRTHSDLHETKCNLCGKLAKNTLERPKSKLKDIKTEKTKYKPILESNLEKYNLLVSEKVCFFHNRKFTAIQLENFKLSYDKMIFWYVPQIDEKEVDTITDEQIIEKAKKELPFCDYVRESITEIELQKEKKEKDILSEQLKDEKRELLRLKYLYAKIKKAGQSIYSINDEIYQKQNLIREIEKRISERDKMPNYIRLAEIDRLKAKLDIRNRENYEQSVRKRKKIARLIEKLEVYSATIEFNRI